MIKVYSGAEATIYKNTVFEKDVFIKQRILKEYRNKILDAKIIKQRNKQEANLLKKLKKININCPFVYYVGPNKIIMQEIKNDNKHTNFLEQIGEQIAVMHNNNIIHGDLNLINILTFNKQIYFIDFGLGFISGKVEDKATDLLVFKKTLKSSANTKDFWNRVVNGYLKKTNNKEIIEKIKDVEKRGRYL
jgi:bifunctional N6-L-threonylcarbamoyladenine synthase / protein kinase Bud32